MKCTKSFTGFWFLLLAVSVCAPAQDPGWPRTNVQQGGTLVSYQPQVDDWKHFTNIIWRQAFQLTPAGGKQVVGAATLSGTTIIDNDTHMVMIHGIKVTDTYFPSLDQATSAKMDTLYKSFVPQDVSISLERVAACVPKPESVKTVNLNNDPPRIFISYSPAILLGIDGKPVLSDVDGTDLRYVVNTTWPLFQDKRSSTYFLLVNNIWLKGNDLNGPWARVTKLSGDFEKIPNSGKFAEVKKEVPPPKVSNPIIPKVFYSTVPAEAILFDGNPAFTNIPGTRLAYANNTDSPVFVYSPTQTYYYLAAGRWFSAKSLAGPWTFASLSLPPDFSNIPISNPAGSVLASVPGTPQAKDAVLIAQIPTTMILNPTDAAKQAKVTYDGTPKFTPIDGTSLSYATNTADKVIKYGDVYYLCLQGVWFMSPNAEGPWTTAKSVPQEIYTIPPSSPVYNVTYVTQTTTSDGYVESSYTAGYFGAFVMGAAVGTMVAYGTGFYYPPYIWYPAYGYPIYRPYPMCYGAIPYYNTWSGAYGFAQTAYGPYGVATRAAQYNPYTGTYARGASASTAYGRRTVGEAYNPYTGTYAATRQGASPTAQWGQSYVSQGNRAAYTQHLSTSRGTVASAQGLQGGRAYGSSTARGNTAVGRSSSGDLYAGHDGNVYKNTGSGWQKYDNSSGSWNNVNIQQAQQEARQRAQTYQQQHPEVQANAQQREQSLSRAQSSGGWSTQNLNNEMQNRQRGEFESRNFQNRGWSRGGWGGGGRSWGGARGGGFRRR